MSVERVRFRRANEGRGTTYLTIAYAHRGALDPQVSECVCVKGVGGTLEMEHSKLFKYVA